MAQQINVWLSPLVRHLPAGEYVLALGVYDYTTGNG